MQLLPGFRWSRSLRLQKRFRLQSQLRIRCDGRLKSRAGCTCRRRRSSFASLCRTREPLRHWERKRRAALTAINLRQCFLRTARPSREASVGTISSNWAIRCIACVYVILRYGFLPNFPHAQPEPSRSSSRANAPFLWARPAADVAMR